MKYKIGDIIKHKNHFLQVVNSKGCGLCFFNWKNYPYDNEQEQRMYYRTFLYKCAIFDEKCNIAFKEISEIEYLILKGDKND